MPAVFHSYLYKHLLDVIFYLLGGPMPANGKERLVCDWKNGTILDLYEANELEDEYKKDAIRKNCAFFVLKSK